MIVRTHYITTSLLIIASLLIIFLIISGIHYHRDNTLNKSITLMEQELILEAEELDLSQSAVRFAHAHHLQQKGLFEEAVTAYSIAERLAPPEDITKIQYNLANLYLQQAVELAGKGQVDRAVALADVAKGRYRTVLAANATMWDAKYNYEAAQRLSRDLPLGKAQIIQNTEEGSAELWSAMPGFPVGLP